MGLGETATIYSKRIGIQFEAASTEGSMSAKVIQCVYQLSKPDSLPSTAATDSL